MPHETPKWIPTPWTLSGSVGGISIDSANTVFLHIDNGWEEDMPTAQLIAAAPELYAACQLADLMFQRKNHSDSGADWMGDDEHEAWTAIRKAMAKARGEQPEAPKDTQS